jgi:hypothetical protein
MDSFNCERGALQPLPYHNVVVDYFRQYEPEVWQWFGSRSTHEEQLASLRAMLLRDTYRIEVNSHPEIHHALSTAMSRLGITAPATLYQSSQTQMNAMLVFVLGEVHIILHGPLLEKMSGDELLAVFGHELAHYLLWADHENQYLTADRILSDTLASERASASHRETARRYALHTELFADRGAAIAAGSVNAAISALVKVQTGISIVDAEAYLRQALEIEAQESQASDQQSHPETFIRARALALWWESANNLLAWLEARLHGPLALESLDLPDQLRLQALTRGFFAYCLDGGTFASDATLAQIRILFPDWSDKEMPIGPEALGGNVADDSVRNYLNALMIDLALADPDQQDAALLHAGRIAKKLGSFDALQVNLKRDAGFGKRELDRFKRELEKESRQ